MEPKLQVTSIDKFAGQISDLDDGEDSQGMVQQINMLSEITGTLTTRGGLKEITLDVLE